MAHARPNSPSRARAHARRLQTHGASRAKQYEEWSQLIRNYCKAKKLFVISVNDASTGDLFCNREIGRALPQASIVELLEQLVLGVLRQAQGLYYSPREMLVLHYQLEQLV